MSLEDEDEEMGSMSLTELLLKELEAEVLKPQHFEGNDDDEDSGSGNVREAHTPPPVFKNWQTALMKSRHSRSTSESESAPSFGDVLDTVVSSADDQETYTSIINKCALEGSISCPTSSNSTRSVPNTSSGSAANNMMHPNFRFARPPQGSLMGPPTSPMMIRPCFSMNGPPPGHMMNGPHGPMMTGPHGPMMNGLHGPMMNGPHGNIMNGPQGHMNGPRGPMNGPSGHMNGPIGPMNGAHGHMIGPRGPMNGPRGPMNGPRGPTNGPHGPMNGPHGPMNGPHGPMNGPHGPMNGLHGPMNGPHGPMSGPHGPMNGPHGPMNGPPGLMNGPPPGPMNGPPPSHMNVPPPSPMNVPPPGPMNVPPPGPMNGPPGPLHFPGPMNMIYDMSFNMMNNSMHGYPVPNVFPNPSYANLPISVAAIPDTTLSTQLKSIKKRRQRKDINETITSNISGDASVSTTTAPLPSKSLPSPPSEMSFIPPAPLPDNAPPSPLKTPVLRHVKEHKIVMKLQKRTMKEPPKSGITSRAKKTIIADYGSSSDDEKDKPESHRKKALHHSITSVRLGENEALPDLYCKLRKLNEELAMLQQQDEGPHSSSSDTSDDEEMDSTNKIIVDASAAKCDGMPLPPLPSVTLSTISPIRPNLDARIKMMMDDKNTPPIKKPPVPATLVAFRRPMPLRQVARLPKNAFNTRGPIPAAVETSMLKPLARPPSPFLSTEIYHYWHKESIKFSKYRKKSHIPYVDPKGRHNFHKGRFVHIQSKPLRSQAALDIYSLLDKKLKNDSNLNSMSTQKKALLTEEIERDMKRLEAINRELKMLEEEEDKNKSFNTKEGDKEPSEDLRQLEELNKKWRELQTEDDNGLPSSDGGSDDDEDLKRLEELNRELRKLEEEEENSDEADDTDKQESGEPVEGGSDLIKKIIPTLADNLEPELVESVGGDLKRLEEINKALEEMETDGPDESAAVDRPDECYGKESNIPSINCLQESLAFQRARDMSGDAVGPKEPADELPTTDRGPKRPADQELISLVMNSVMEELKKDLRNSIASNLLNDKMLEYGPMPMKKQKTSVA